MMPPGCSEYSTGQYLLGCLTGYEDYCSNPELAGDYDIETLLDNCMTSLYIGVRFE